MLCHVRSCSVNLRKLRWRRLKARILGSSPLPSSFALAPHLTWTGMNKYLRHRPSRSCFHPWMLVILVCLSAGWHKTLLDGFQWKWNRWRGVAKGKKSLHYAAGPVKKGTDPGNFNWSRLLGPGAGMSSAEWRSGFILRRWYTYEEFMFSGTVRCCRMGCVHGVHERPRDETDSFPEHNEINLTAIMIHQ